MAKERIKVIRLPKQICCDELPVIFESCEWKPKFAKGEIVTVRNFGEPTKRIIIDFNEARRMYQLGYTDGHTGSNWMEEKEMIESIEWCETFKHQPPQDAADDK